MQEAETEAVRVEAEMYVIARQLWSGLFPKQARCRRMTPMAGGTPSCWCSSRSTRITASPKTSFAMPAPVPKRSRRSSEPRTSCACPSRTAADHRDAGVSARQLGRLSQSGPAARCQGVELLRHQPAAARLGPAPRAELHGGIQPQHAPDPDDPRGVSGPLRAAGIFQSPSVADSQGACFRACSPKAGRSTPSR